MENEFRECVTFGTFWKDSKSGVKMLKDTNIDITEIYRETGKILRKQGAARVYILRSRILPGKYKGEGIQMQMEVIADQLNDCAEAMEELRNVFDNVEYTLYDGAADENYELLKEAEEDGIQL